MRVLLVRHGHAGTKRQWPGDDEYRPLDAQGLGDAQALVPLLASFTPARIVSSPYLRCTQSMTPLGRALGIEVESSPSLTPIAGRVARKLLLGVSAHGSGAVVVCTHGEVIHQLQASLGKQAPHNFNADAPREKASVWVLERSSGRFVSARYILPPKALDAVAQESAHGDVEGQEDTEVLPSVQQ